MSLQTGTRLGPYQIGETPGITALVSMLVTLDEVIGNAPDLSSRLIVVEVAASPEGGILANGRALSSFQV